jgi:GNAT superfamily N-acetyltransferase
MSDLELRPARPDEVDAVLRFWAVSAEGTSVSDDTAGVRRLIERDPEALILAVDGDRIVGSVIAGFDGWRCHLYRLAVAPDRRREGIGSLLIGAAELRFAALGGRRADAMVLERNRTAHGGVVRIRISTRGPLAAVGETVALGGGPAGRTNGRTRRKFPRMLSPLDCRKPGTCRRPRIRSVVTGITAQIGEYPCQSPASSSPPRSTVRSPGSSPRSTRR